MASKPKSLTFAAAASGVDPRSMTVAQSTAKKAAGKESNASGAISAAVYSKSLIEALRF
jgi:hypothetical protein